MAIQVATAGVTGFSNIKKSIRDTERLLRSKGASLPATVVQEQERKLKALQVALRHGQKPAVVPAKHFAQRYKEVRFIEGKKAVRRLLKAQKTGDAAAEAEAVKDCLYVQFFPEDVRYISLFPTEPTIDSEQLARRAEFRDAIALEHAPEEIKLPGFCHVAAGHTSSGKGHQKTSDHEDDDYETEEYDDGDESPASESTELEDSVTDEFYSEEEPNSDDEEEESETETDEFGNDDSETDEDTDPEDYSDPVSGSPTASDSGSGEDYDEETDSLEESEVEVQGPPKRQRR